MNKKHIGSNFDDWMHEEGIDDDEMKHRIRIRLNEVRNSMIEAHRRMKELSPEDARVKFEEDIAEWLVNYGKVNIFSLEYPENTKIKTYLKKFA